MNTDRYIILFAIIIWVTSCKPQTSEKQIPPIVAVHFKPVPPSLKLKLKYPFVLSSGVTSFGTQANPIWAVCSTNGNPRQRHVLEFWIQKQGDFSRLRHIGLPIFQRESSSIYALSHMKFRWLIPSQQRAPIIIFSASDMHVVYAFEKGWKTKQPVIQKLGTDSSTTWYYFDSIDRRGILECLVDKPKHATAEDDPPFYTYDAHWKNGYGWEIER